MSKSHKRAEEICRAVGGEGEWSVENLGGVLLQCTAKRQEDGIPGFRPWTEKQIEIRQGGMLCYRKGGGGDPEAYHLIGEYQLCPSDKKCKGCSIEACPIDQGAEGQREEQRRLFERRAMKEKVLKKETAYYLFQTIAQRDACLSAFDTCLGNLLNAGLKEPAAAPTRESTPKTKPSQKAKQSNTARATGGARPLSGHVEIEKTMVVATTRAAAEDLSDDEEWCLEDEEAPAAESAPQGGTRKEEHQRRGDTASDDYYKVLGVERDADARDIKRAYRREALVHHPDKNPSDKEGAEARFKTVSEAYEVLSSPEARAKYDEGGKKGQKGKDASDVFRDFFGDDDLDEIFSKYDPVWARRTGRYRDKGQFRGNIAQFRPNRFGKGWQVGQAKEGRHGRGGSPPAIETHKHVSTRRVAGGVERIVEEYLVIDGRKVKRKTTTFIDARGSASESDVINEDQGAVQPEHGGRAARGSTGVVQVGR